MNITEVEICTIDRHLESSRQRNIRVEKKLLSSISEQGVQDPVLLIHDESGHKPILIDGFKRLRCCITLSHLIIPACFIANQIVDGICTFLRHQAGKNLTILEEAELVSNLHQENQLSVIEISQRLSRSGAWVSLRMNIFNTMPEIIRCKILSGLFPLRSYLYDLKKFTRVKSQWPVVERFVNSVSGKNIPTRDMSRLIKGYFNGSDEFRNQIDSGNVLWTLEQIKKSDSQTPIGVYQKADLYRHFEEAIHACGICEKQKILVDILNKIKELKK